MKLILKVREAKGLMGLKVHQDGFNVSILLPTLIDHAYQKCLFVGFLNALVLPIVFIMECGIINKI
jgi:hypothetical protein